MTMNNRFEQAVIGLLVAILIAIGAVGVELAVLFSNVEVNVEFVNE